MTEELYREARTVEERYAAGALVLDVRRAPAAERAVAAWEKVKAAWLQKFGPDRMACVHPRSSEELLGGYCSECAEDFCDEIADIVLEWRNDHALESRATSNDTDSRLDPAKFGMKLYEEEEAIADDDLVMKEDLNGKD